MADIKPTVSALSLSTLPGASPRSTSGTREIPILQTIAAVKAGNMTAEEAAKELQFLRAPSWLIASLRSIEQQFSDPAPDYCGPMSSAVGKVLGDV